MSDGDLGSIISGINNTAGVTKMSWFSATGMTGDFVFAYVTLNATGSADETSELNLTVKKLVDTGNNPIAHTVDEGMFTASAGPPLTPTSPQTTPTPTATATAALPTSTPTPTSTPMVTPTPVTTTPTTAPTTEAPIATPPPKATPTPTPTPPCFEAVFAIAGLLAIAYLVLRKKK
ncbi:MAG: hypothetical protein J7K81_01885 [Methanophagales archaeon]|nr:hypothetical protein [Methanophagales archaeon]